MRFLFLNQYGPPDPVPTARLLGELAEGLRADGHTVEIISQNQSYLGRPARGRRLKRELQAAWAILRGGWKRRSGRPDVVLALTSPPGLLVVGALLAMRHRARLAHWAMDLYPELALVLGEIRTGSLVAHAVQTAMRWAYRRASLVVALDEDMRDHLQAFCRVQVRVTPPWSAKEIERQADDEHTKGGGPAAPWVCLYSGNLGRAHEWRTLLDSQALLEQRGLPISLVFQGDGAGRAAAMAYAEKLGLRHCDWIGYAAEEELLPALLRAQVLVVTQRPETRGLLWPSKLALIERLPRAILFIGPKRGAIASNLRQHGHTGVFAPGESAAVAQWVEGVFCGKIRQRAQPMRPLPTFDEKSSQLQRWLLDC